MPIVFLYFFLLLITTSLTNPIPTVYNNCIEAQKQSLLQFKESLLFGSSSSSKLITWNSSTDCCSWLGVTCSRYGNVVELDLSRESISCSIDSSSSLFQLQNLQSLNLAYNDFNRSSIPFAIGKLADLRYLNLSSAYFSGQIPIEVACLTRLVTLDLSKNHGSINHQPLLVENPNLGLLFQNLTTLAELYLDSVDLSTQESDWCEAVSSSLPNLRVLSLFDCGIPGPICESLAKLQSLYDLNISRNQIHGEIPNWIFSLKSLTSLDLSCNSFVTVEPPLPNSTSSLSSLDLHSNMLEDIPSSYSFLQLDSLVLASNKLTTFPDFLRNQSTLNNLDLSDNQIQGQIPNWIWSPSPPQKINLSCNSLSDLQAPLQNSTYFLHSLDLHSNQLQGQIPVFLSGRYLDYSRNNFTSGLKNDILISGMYFLSLSSNNLLGAIPESICRVGYIVLDLSNNSLSGNIPQCLAQFSPSVLNLSRNKITGSIPDYFEQGCRLETLDLSRNQLHGQFPKSLVHCSRLVVLNVGNNYIANAFPCVLMGLSTLRVLVLRSNKFYGSIGCPNTNGTNLLQVIDLADNSFSGNIDGRMFMNWHAMISNVDDSPTNLEFRIFYKGEDHPSKKIYHPSTKATYVSYSYDSLFYRVNPVDVYYRDTITTIFKGVEWNLVKILTIFTLVDFSSNKFDGSIPDEVGELKSLYVLNLSSNTLTGKIPSSFGQMQQLESLDLSNNQLSGKIPQQMANLTFLAVLDLSNNQLIGKIPTGTQFSTFPNTSFQGNKGLWGPPLTVDALLPPPTPNGSSSHLSSGDGIDWDIIFVEIGFTCGFGLVVGSLLLCKRWRKWYYRAMPSILFKIFPQLEHRFGNHRRHVYVNTRR